MRKDNGKYRNECRACDKLYQSQYREERVSRKDIKNAQRAFEQETGKRICIHCLLSKDLNIENFGSHEGGVLRRVCRICSRSKIKESFSKLPDEEKFLRKEKQKNKGKLYRDSNKEKEKIRHKIYNDSDSGSSKRRKRENARIKNDPAFRLKKFIPSYIRTALRKIGCCKNNTPTFDYLPYTPQDLKIHLESLFEPWMTWDNWGVYDSEVWNDNDPTTWTWHIDHIIPQSLFPYSSLEDENFQKCWSLSNLRPYSAKHNIQDGANRVRHNLQRTNYE